MGKRRGEVAPGESLESDRAARLRRLAERFHRPLAAKDVDRLLQFVQLLHEWNARINLTGARSAEAIIEGQLPDSFALASLLPERGRWVDVGAGGGLPALPTAVLRPELTLTLAEPRSRRRAFLSTAVRELGLSATVVGDRDDRLPAGGFEVASARAVFNPSEWLTRGFRLVIPAGRVALFLTDDGSWLPPSGIEVTGDSRYQAGDSKHRLVIVTRPG